MSLFLIIASYAVVQSLFGVGLLVFGTPTLLLLGYSYQQTLSILLPCSICVSSLQLIEHWGDVEKFKKEFSLWCLPFIAVGLIIMLTTQLSISLNYFVGLLLVFGVLCRVFPSFQLKLQSIVTKHKFLYLSVMGLIHGLSNMGGGLLTIYSNALHNDKVRIRAYIAFGYLLMATVQSVVLLCLDQMFLSISNLYLIALTGITYWIVGKKIYLNTSELVYRHAMTVMMACFGIFMFVF